MSPRTKGNLAASMNRRNDAETTKVEQTSKMVYDGNLEKIISTGSTLLDLNILGGRIRGGGIPAGTFVEIFGPPQTGKTVMLSELAGGIQRQKGDLAFYDPEGRLNKEFAKIFDFTLKEKDYYQPDTVVELFKAVRGWVPTPKDKHAINGIFADSLAALSTEMEMGSEDGDKMGGKRAKDFSEQLRKTCRLLAQKDYLMVCSNQIRMNMGQSFGPKYSRPGGLALDFYASLILKVGPPLIDKIIYKIVQVNGVEVKKAIGINTDVHIFKSSIWKPYRSAQISIIFDYGIDDIRQNLKYIKRYTKNTTYMVGEKNLGTGLEMAIIKVEKLDLEIKLKDEVIDLWEEIELKFDSNRKKKKR